MRAQAKAENRLTLLYVDDDRINTLLFVETCRPDARLEVLTAARGDDAVSLAQEFAFDVLVIDLHLPDTDGLKLLAALRQLPHCQPLPAFLCTAERIEEARDPAIAAGFDGVWIKPVQLPAILSDINAAQARRPASLLQGVQPTSAVAHLQPFPRSPA